MATVFDYYSPAELSDLSRQIQASQAPKPADLDYFVTRDYFVPEIVDDIEYRVKAGSNGVPSSAKFRAFDTENAIGIRPGFAGSQGSLLPLGMRIPFTEKDRLTIRRADPQQYQQALAEAAQETTLGTIVRMERGAVQSLLTGKFTLENERGVTDEADWGRAASRTVTSIAKPWSDPSTSTPLADFQAWNDLLDTEVDWLMTRSTMALLKQSASFRNLASIQMTGMPDTVTNDFINSQLTAYEVGTIRRYDAKYLDDTKVERNILPHGYVLGVPRGVGRAVWGVSAEAMDPENKLMRADWPGVVTLHERTSQPKQDWVNTSALGMPVLGLPDKTIAVKVIA